MGSRVTVVISTRDRVDELVVTLEHLRELPEQPPVVVVDNDSRDATAGTVRAQYPDVQLLSPRRNLGGAGRNLGVAWARTPYVAFADDDSWWLPGALPHAAQVLDAHPRLALLAARVLVGPQQVPDPLCDLMAASPLPREPDLPGPSVLGFMACGAVVRAAPFVAAGGFDEVFGVGGEEAALSLDLASAGWGLSYVDTVVARHMPSPVRDREARRRRVIRNELLVQWMRRNRRDAIRFTARATTAARRDRVVRGALGDALRLASVAVARRRPVPERVEAQLRVLDGRGEGAETGRRARRGRVSSERSLPDRITTHDADRPRPHGRDRIEDHRARCVVRRPPG